jgi:Domain of unknown function (DUF932)
MTLMIHAGAKVVSFDDLMHAATPEATRTHMPVPHHEIVALVRDALSYYEHEIVEEHHALMPDGRRYFGLMTLRSQYDDYADTVGLRNAHDKSFAIGIAFGSRVFVCDNTAFIGDHIIARKHTSKAKRHLPGLITEIMQPLHLQRRKQSEKFQTYKATRISDETADHAIMTLYREGVINAMRIAHILMRWERPQHDWGEKSAWRLFNAATSALADGADRPARTAKLHEVIDGVCAQVAA